MKKLLTGLLAIATLSTSFADVARDFRDMTAEDTKGSIQTLNIFNSIVSYPYPSWFENGLIGDIHQQKNNKTFIYDEVPVGQTVEKWQELYSVYGVYDDSPRFHLGSLVDATFKPFAKNCGKGNLQVKALRIKENDELYLVFCGSYDNHKEAAKPYGEVGIFRFIKNEQDYIRIAQEWKIESYRVNDTNAIKDLDTNTINSAITTMLENTFVSDKIAMQ